MEKRKENNEKKKNNKGKKKGNNCMCLIFWQSKSTKSSDNQILVCKMTVFIMNFLQIKLKNL